MTILLCAQLWVTELQSILTHSTSPDLFLTYPYNQERGEMNFLPTPVSSRQPSVTRTCQVYLLNAKPETLLSPCSNSWLTTENSEVKGGRGSGVTQHHTCTALLVSECRHKPTNFLFYFIFLLSSFRLPIYYLFMHLLFILQLIILFIYLLQQHVKYFYVGSSMIELHSSFLSRMCLLRQITRRIKKDETV